MSFHLAKGFVLQGVRVGEKGNSPLPFVMVEEVRFSVPLPDLLRTGRVFIPAITLQKPLIHINRITDNQWNFSDLLTPKTDSKTSPQGAAKIKPQESRFSLGGVNIENGQIIISDPHATQTITDLEASVHTLLPDRVHLTVAFGVPVSHSTFKANGEFITANKELKAVIDIKNLNPPAFISLTGVPLYVVFDQWLITTAELNFKFKDGEFLLAGSMAGTVDITTKTSPAVRTKGTVISENFIYRKKGRDFDVRGKFLAPNTAITINNDKTFAGNFSGTNIDFQKRGDQFHMTGDVFDREAKMIFAGQTLTGDTEVKSVRFNKQGSALDLSGLVKITKGTFKDEVWDITAGLSTAAIKILKKDADIVLKVPNFSSQSVTGFFLDKMISGNIDGENINITDDHSVLTGQGHFKTQNLSITTSPQIKFEGHPAFDLVLNRDPQIDSGRLNYSGAIFFADDTLLGLPKIGGIKNLKGKLSFSRDQASSENLNFVFQHKPISLSGTIKNFKAPQIQATLSKENLKVSLTGTADENIISFSSLRGQYYKSSFDLTGDIEIRSTPPNAHLKGMIQLDLTDLALLKDPPENLEAISPAGVVTFKGEYILPAMSLQKLNLSAKITSPSVTLYGYNFQNIAADCSTREENVKDIKLTTVIYDGRLSVDAKLALTAENVPVDISAEISGFDLSQLKKNFPSLEKKDFSGTLSANLKMSGPFFNPKNLKGTGAILVNNGKLLEFEVLKGIWKILFNSLIVEDYKRIEFAEGKASFKIAGGRLSTEDLILKSVPADLSARGWIDLDRNINFDVIAKVREAPLVGASVIQAVPTTIISQVVKNIIGIKLTGTFSEPQIKYKILPLKMLEKTTGSIFQGITGMMEDILDH